MVQPEVSNPEAAARRVPSIGAFFARHWEKFALWGLLIGLFYLLKPFALLVFETFLITYFTKSAVDYVVARSRFDYRFTVVMVFVVFVAVLGLGASWAGPRLVIESNQLISDFAGQSDQQTQEKINRFVEILVKKAMGEQKAQDFLGSKEYAMAVESVKNDVANAAKAALPKVLQGLLHLAALLWEIVVSLVLAIVFSFILVMDWRRIAASMRSLETSRIRTFYLATAPHMQAFVGVMGKALRAQALIALVNTILTAGGLWVFGMPKIALLSCVVFLCGFIPVAGTFISSIPILLFGIQLGGLGLMFKLIALIAAVHAIEAYVLNPKITGEILHVHPILVLVLLLIGERFFGIWGMVVGVPVGYYILTLLTAKDEGVGSAEEPPPGNIR